ncbi:MAG: DinB family protein [Rhodothermales bacterium]
MTAPERLADQIRRAVHGPAWHGPSVREALEGITVAQAARRHDGAHTIWEIVLHIDVWQRVALRRLRGDAFEPTAEEDWPMPPRLDEPGWTDTLAGLDAGTDALTTAIAHLPASRLEEPVPGKPYALGMMLMGVPQHAAYHAGQIVVLRKRHTAA